LSLAIILVIVSLAAAAGLGAYFLGNNKTAQQWVVKVEKPTELEMRSKAEERNQINEALQRVPEVNAQAKDLGADGQYDAALAEVDEVLRTVEAPELLETKVNLLLNCNRANQGYQTLLKLLGHRTNDAHLHYIAGNLAANLEGPKAALIHYETASKLEPTSSDYRISWAICCVRSGQKEAGLGAFEKLVIDEPDCYDCWYNYGVSLLESGAPDEALAIRREAVKRFPENSKHHFGLAQMLDVIARKSGDSNKLNEAAAE